MKPVGVAVVGAGYWGPNLVRNFHSNPGADLRWVCDIDEERAAKVVGRYSTVGVASSLDTVLDDAGVDAVAVATPAGTHHQIATAALGADKHVLIEKPLASTVAERTAMVEVAERRRLVL